MVRYNPGCCRQRTHFNYVVFQVEVSRCNLLVMGRNVHLMSPDRVINLRTAINITESSKVEESDTVACKALLSG